MFDKTNNIIQSENIDNMVYDGIGFDGIRYIQQTGQKVQGKIYLDKTQPGLWYCLKTTSAINNTSDFTRADSTALLDKLQNFSKIIYKTINIDNIRFDFTRCGNFTTVSFSEHTPKSRAYLEVIAQSEAIPIEFRPYSGIVVECIQAPNTGVFRLKLHADGSIINLYRYGDESVIYNNNIENSLFGYINNIRIS